MEKNKPNDKRSRSAPSGAKRSLVRFCFAVMTISLLVCSMIAPASAMMLGTEDPASNVTYRTCLTGVAGFSFRDSFADSGTAETGSHDKSLYRIL